MGVHKPTVVWCLRRGFEPPYVRTESAESILIQFADSTPGWHRGYSLSRRDARLLAKRINECLDDTRS